MANDETTKTLIVEIPWHDEHDDKLRIAARGDLDIVKNQVQQRVAQLWRCTSEKNSMLVVTRVDPGPELCIVLGEGSGLLEFAPYFIREAKKNNMGIRTHVTRKGLIRLWSKLNINVNEYVLRG